MASARKHMQVSIPKYLLCMSSKNDSTEQMKANVKNPLIKNPSASGMCWVTQVTPGKAEGDFPYEKCYLVARNIYKC